MHLQSAILLLVSAVCAVTDAGWGKVYNLVTYPSALVGLGLSFYFPPPPPVMSLSGLFAGLVVFGFVRRLTGMGAGDVKLMAAVGALKGLPFLLYGSFYILCAATVIALVLVAWQGRLLAVLKWVAYTLAAVVSPRFARQGPKYEMTSMPFAPAIFIGSAFAIYLEAVNGPFTL